MHSRRRSPMVAPPQNPTDADELDIEPPDESDDDGGVAALHYEIASYPADYTLRVLNDQINEGQLVTPEFQRNYVWSPAQASKLIESFLLGLPIPEVFLYKERNTERRLVVDGQQRLKTISFFYRERFEDDKVFRLRGVDERWNGKVYSDLEEIDRVRLDNSTLRSIIIQQLNPDDLSSIYLVFERLNTGGTRLSPMEIRRALVPGDAYAFLDDLNQNIEWRKLIGLTKPHRRLRDVELVLRVLGLASARASYEKPLKTFLNNYMYTLQDMSDDQRTSMKRDFEQACTVALEGLGEKPFHIRGPLNVAVLDSVLGVLASKSAPDTAGLGDRYKLLLDDQEFLGATESATTDERSIERRFTQAAAILLQ